jgi:hypothetical protein
VLLKILQVRFVRFLNQRNKLIVIVRSICKKDKAIGRISVKIASYSKINSISDDVHQDRGYARVEFPLQLHLSHQRVQHQIQDLYRQAGD